MVKKNEDFLRLSYSLTVVMGFFCLWILYSHVPFSQWLSFLSSVRGTKVRSLAPSDSYNYLAETNNILKKKKKYKPILSDRDSAGSGGLTEKMGFHTLSPHDRFSILATPTMLSRKAMEKIAPSKGKGISIRILKDQPKQVKVQKPQPNKIPTNYYFKRQFAFRWDFSRYTFMPTKRFPAFRYIQRMFRKIEERLSLPGGLPMVFIDRAGRVTSQSILPQVIDVAIMLDTEGRVVDVRVMNEPAQQKVAASFIEAIKDNAFGPLPPALKKEARNGRVIIGVSFIIPDLSKLF